MMCHLTQPPITINCLVLECCIALFAQCDIWVAEMSESRKHVILSRIPSYHPLRNNWEQNSNFIQPLFFSLYCAMVAIEHISWQVPLKKISITQANSVGHPTGIIPIVLLTTDHLWGDDINTKHFLDHTIIIVILIDQDHFGVKKCNSLCNLTKDLIKWLPEQTYLTCWLFITSILANLSIHYMAGYPVEGSPPILLLCS